MTKLVNLTIDDVQVQVPEGTLIVNAAKKAGIDVPVFCYHPKMEPVGMCRMCLVEIGRPMIDRNTGELMKDETGMPKMQFGPKLETACTTPVTEGMIVRGASPAAAAGRKDIIEFLLTSHPLDCPICDKGGECPLQNLTMEYGPGESRFIYNNKYQFDKHVPLGELIVLDRERCIQCARCIRFQTEIVDDPVISFFQRNRGLEIITFSEPGFDSYYSGNTTDICPVGALVTNDFRFEARPWELKSAASICPHCPVGCNTTINVRREARAKGEIVAKRVMPRQNEKVNEIWICDKGRFVYHYTQSGDRLREPLVRKDGGLQPVTWTEAYEYAANRLKEAGKNMAVLAGGRLSNEDLFNLRQLAAGLGGKAIQYSSMAGGDLVARLGVGKGTNLADLGPGSVVFVVASDLEEEAPLWWLRIKQAAERGATLIVANARPTKLDRAAAQVIRYTYGSEASTVLQMVSALTPKGPDTPKTSVPEALTEAAVAIAQAENAIIIYGQDGAGYQASQDLAQACANLLVATNHFGRPNNGLMAAWPVGNTQGAWDMGLQPVPDLPAALEGMQAMYIAAADPVGDDPALAETIRKAGFLMVQELFLTATAQMADVVLPAQSFMEREGSYTNGERRVQRFYPAVPPQPFALPDCEITAEIGKRLGLDLEGRAPMLIFEKRIAASVPGYAGLTYRLLSQVEEQWPIIGREDLYYGGTSYENTQGLGVQLPAASESGEKPALSRVEPPAMGAPETGLLAVPVTRLYDRGLLMLYTKLLSSRLPQPYVSLNPADAERLRISDGSLVSLDLGDGKPAHVQAAAQPGETALQVRVDPTVPVGIVLVPRSLGIVINQPVPVRVMAAKAAKA